MGNIWVNLEFGDSGFAPYLGGGIGAMRIETNDVSVIGFDLSDESDTVGAGQLGAGIGYRITDNFSVSFVYRFLMSEDPEFDEVERSEERRGGKECVSTCGSRGSPYRERKHELDKINIEQYRRK